MAGRAGRAFPLDASRRRGRRGQALVEFAVVFPIFAMLFFGVISLGLYVFYQQQVTNAAREAARYASIHSATAQCPTVSHQTPQAPPLSYYACDTPVAGWPKMTAQGRAIAAGTSSSIGISACWSGYRRSGSTGPADDQPVDPATGMPNPFIQCTIGGLDPIAATGSIACPPPVTTSADDPASDTPGNRVTVYACMHWNPPLAGFLGVPDQVTIRAVVTEEILRQQ